MSKKRKKRSPAKPNVIKFQEPSVMAINPTELGSSGTEIHAGLYDEEYFKPLTQHEAADIYDKMRRSDTQVSMSISSVVNAITGGRWRIDPPNKDVVKEEEGKKHADLMNHIFFEDLDKPWDKKLKEIMTVIVFGHSVFERTHKIVKNDPLFGTYIGIKKLGWRSPKTITRWNFNLDTKDFEGIEQQDFGDLASNKIIDIPAKDLIIFNLDDEGDNLEGIAMLRQCYGSWKRKELFLKLQAIGIERTALGVVLGKYPSPEYDSAEYNQLKAAIRALSSHHKNFLMLPQNENGLNWDVEIMKLEYDADKVKSAIDYEDMSIARKFLAQFLMLGGSGTSGSWALSTDQSEFFLNGLVFIADMIGGVLDKLIEELVDFNFGPQKAYPKFAHSRIKDKAGKELADIVKLLKDAGIIIPDDTLEKFYRKSYDMPDKEEGMDRETLEAKKIESEDKKFKQDLAKSQDLAKIAEAKNNPNPKPDDKKNNPKPKDIKKDAKGAKVEDKSKPAEKKKFSEDVIMFAETIRKEIEKESKKFEVLYEDELKKIGYDLAEQVTKNFKEASPDAQVLAARNIQARGVAKYRKSMVNTLGEVVETAQDGAFKELDKAPEKLSEVKILADADDRSKKNNKRYTVSTSDALTETQISDVKKAVVLTFSAKVNETDDPDIIRKEMRNSVDKDINRKKGNSATVASLAINTARENVFFDPRRSEIESFTFVNASPVAQICIDLAGVTFAPDDKKSFPNRPPNHHNCKSHLKVNFTGVKNNPEVDPIGLSGGNVTKGGHKSKTLGEVENNCSCATIDNGGQDE
ncbi:MAG: DUF935 family protein [Candidatus Peribacteraceae bacterium]|nr:DUF935 family protein [Candidatus Peribacteraceae bacterium]